MPCAFVVSPSYSGSTLLSILLAHHPHLATLGEFLDNHARRYRDGEGDFCSCGERLSSCPYMLDLAERVRAVGMDFSVDFPDTAFWGGTGLQQRILRAYVRGPGFETARRLAVALTPSARRTVARIVERNTRVIAAVLEGEGASVYLDSAKNNNRVLFFHRYAAEMDVRVIWLIRDGRGVATSIMRHRECDLSTAIEQWKTTQTSVMHTVALFPADRVLKLHYEDLCTRPAEALERTCRFLGLDPALMPARYGDLTLHLTGNNMRLKGLSEIRVDTRWEQTLTEADLQVFERDGGALNRELGY